MNLRFTDNKTLMIIITIGLAVLAIGMLLFFSIREKNQVITASIQDGEEKIEEKEIEKDNSEPIVVEYIDIEQLENKENKQEEEKDKNKEDDKTNNKNDNKTPYYIKVNYGAQVVTIYSKDENGEYTKPVKAMVCSTGDYTPPCSKYPSKQYKLPGNKYRWLGLQGNVCGQYATQVTGNILFHSVPYLRKGDNASLEYWEYDKLGTRASAGCIRLTVSDARWIYENISSGTTVEFYSDSNPGPLGKPSAKKISSYPDELRNWDPTDSDSKNPWHTYKENENKTDNSNQATPVTTNTNNNTNNSNKTQAATKTETVKVEEPSKDANSNEKTNNNEEQQNEQVETNTNTEQEPLTNSETNSNQNSESESTKQTQTESNNTDSESNLNLNDGTSDEE